MTRLIDRILERAPGLAETLLGDPGDPGLPLVVPVVVAGDAVFPRAAAALLAGTDLAPPRCTPPWPLTFVEFASPPGLPEVPGGPPAPTAMGWFFLKESGPGGRPRRPPGLPGDRGRRDGRRAGGDPWGGDDRGRPGPTTAPSSSD